MTLDQRTHIILGSGALGLAVANCLRDEGIAPRILNRSGLNAAGWDTVACDARDPAALAAHLAGPVTLYVCSAPSYWLWETEFPQLADGILGAADGRDVHIILADNVYAYGRQAAFREGMPAMPCSRKGTVRKAVADKLMAANGKGLVRTAVVRAATFFGPQVEQSSVGKSVFQAALSGKTAYIIGDPHTAQAFTYVPDLAATMVRVGQHDAGFGRYWHAPSYSGATLQQFLERIAAIGQHKLKLKAAGPRMMRFLGLFNPAMRELIEMLYLHNTPWSFNSELTERSLRVAVTPLTTALARTVASIRPPLAA